MPPLALQAAGLVSANIDIVKAAVLGFVEGLTEYLPVSSTGHLLLMERILGWGDDAFGKSFAVLIQLGAILALLSIYFGRLWNLARTMFTDWAAARFVIGVLLAFLPAARSPITSSRLICLTCASSASRSSSAASSCC
jgi:undecaprenyl-diphosphatase